jgi:hypothetical protein
MGDAAKIGAMISDAFKPSGITMPSKAAGAAATSTVRPGSGTSYPGGGYGSFLPKSTAGTWT